MKLIIANREVMSIGKTSSTVKARYNARVYKPIHVQLKNELVAEWETKLKNDGETKAGFIRKAIEKYLNNSQLVKNLSKDREKEDRMIPIDTEIRSIYTGTAQDGEKEYVINDKVHYSSTHWTLDEAIKDYIDPEAAQQRALDEFSLWID